MRSGARCGTAARCKNWLRTVPRWNVYGGIGSVRAPVFDVSTFRKHPEHFTVVDVRQTQEVKEHRIFSHSINIPLHELREHVSEIPNGKPIAVDCAGGYRSMIAESIIAPSSSAIMYDIGENILQL